MFGLFDLSACGFMTDAFSFSPRRAALGQHLKIGQCEAGAGQEERKPHPVFVHSPFLRCLPVRSNNTTSRPVRFIVEFLLEKKNIN